FQGRPGKRRLGNHTPRDMLFAGAIRGFKAQAPGRTGEPLDRKSAQRHCRRGDRMRRRELMLLLGGMMAVAQSLRAQQKAMPVIGFLSGGSPGPYGSLIAAFRQGMSDTGYVEGQDVAIEYRFAEDHYDRLPALAADLVGGQVDVI